MLSCYEDLHCTILSSIGPAWDPQDSVRYLRMYFVDSVLPAPDSPLTMMDRLTFNVLMSRNDLSAAKGMNVLALCVFKPAKGVTVFHAEFNMSFPKEGTTSHLKGPLTDRNF